MIRRGPLCPRQILGLSLLVAMLVAGCLLARPSFAYAAGAELHPHIPHVVTFKSNGTITQHVTSASTVGAFLAQRGIAVSRYDYVRPAPSVALRDHITITYRMAVPVTFFDGNRTLKLHSTAPNVAAFLHAEHVPLGKFDKIFPSPNTPLVTNERIRVIHIAKWTRRETRPIAARTIRKIVFTLPAGTKKLISSGRPGIRERTMRFTQRDGGDIHAKLVVTRILRTPKPRIVEEGVDEVAAFMDAGHGAVQSTAYVTSRPMHMVATAYTANCTGCSGITALGYHAGHGIVAVDPRVIPLGTRLYIPGYGVAIAGDTGGAIIGNRIDLGFNSLQAAIDFGRRTVTVYRLK
ncbi:MAG: 3D domain-containing protein [Vulcanimicrobiaceae bacterium]